MARPIKYSDEDIKNAVAVSSSMTGVIKMLGAPSTSASLHTHLKSRAIKLGCDLSHFKRPTDFSADYSRASANDLLVFNRKNGVREKAYKLRRALVEIGKKEVCVSCGIGTEWNGKPLMLEIDHIDGNPVNNVPSNLRFMCPNCHSQVAINYTGGTPKLESRSGL